MSFDPAAQWRERQKPHPSASILSEILPMILDAQKSGAADATIFHLFARYDEVVMVEDPRDNQCVAGFFAPSTIMLRIGPLRYSLPVIEGRPRTKGERVERFGIYRLGLDVWTMTPSIRAPGQFHGFVVLVGCPDDPPWAAQPKCPRCGEVQVFDAEFLASCSRSSEPALVACDREKCQAMIAVTSVDPIRISDTGKDWPL